MSYKCCRSVASQQNIIWHLYLELFELHDLGLARLPRSAPSQGREALFAPKRRWGCVRKGFSWCYPWSKMDRGEDTVSLAQLYPTAGCECELVCVWLAMHFFLSLSLFICDSSASARQKGQAGYCHCNLMCVPFAKYTECVWCICVRFFFGKSTGSINNVPMYFYGLFKLSL